MDGTKKALSISAWVKIRSLLRNQALPIDADGMMHVVILRQMQNTGKTISQMETGLRNTWLK